MNGTRSNVRAMADEALTAGERLSAPHVLEFPYTRSLGPVLGAFFTELRERRIVGVRTASGRVLVPPSEYDPETGDEASELVEVGAAGVVTTWAWQGEPRPGQPLERPFAWALIHLDGADTALLHAVDAEGERAMSTGMRVQARWRAETVGAISDIECFEPEEAS